MDLSLIESCQQHLQDTPNLRKRRLRHYPKDSKKFEGLHQCNIRKTKHTLALQFDNPKMRKEPDGIINFWKKMGPFLLIIRARCMSTNVQFKTTGTITTQKVKKSISPGTNPQIPCIYGDLAITNTKLVQCQL